VKDTIYQAEKKHPDISGRKHELRQKNPPFLSLTENKFEGRVSHKQATAVKACKSISSQLLTAKDLHHRIQIILMFITVHLSSKNGRYV